MVIGVNELKIFLKNKSKFNNYPKLPNVIVDSCITVNASKHKIVEKGYEGSHQSVASFLTRVKNWENNELNNAVNNLDRNNHG